MEIQTILCLGIPEFILLAIYAIFVYLGSRRDNFYQARRWKAAVWSSIIMGFLVPSGICIFAILGADKDSKTLDFISMVAAIVLLTLPLVIPLMFINTISTYYGLAWSDNILDKIWKDPNKKNKSPIQPY
jgi:hypothetical protein